MLAQSRTNRLSRQSDDLFRCGHSVQLNDSRGFQVSAKSDRRVSEIVGQMAGRTFASARLQHFVSAAKNAVGEAAPATEDTSPA